MISAVQRYYPNFAELPEFAWSPARSRERPDYSFEEDVSNLARFFAGIATGPDNQDVSMTIEGPKGKGKSYTGVTLSVNAAKWIAEILGDDWRDHWDLERTVAIIDPDRADDVMLSSQKFDVRVFDDISLAWGARNWQSDENKDKNDIFIISRVDNTVNILTTPNTKLIDVVPRSNVNYKGEMDTPYFRFGYTSMKVKTPIPVFNLPTYKELDPYLKHGRDKFVIYMIEAPPPRVIKAYNLERDRITQKIKKERRERLADRRAGVKISSWQDKKNQKSRNAKAEANIQVFLKRWYNIRKNGGGDKEIMKDALGFCKITRNTWRYWRDAGILHRLGVLQDQKTS